VMGASSTGKRPTKFDVLESTTLPVSYASEECASSSSISRVPSVSGGATGPLHQRSGFPAPSNAAMWSSFAVPFSQMLSTNFPLNWRPSEIAQSL